MSLCYFIDHPQRVVVVKPRGRINVPDIFRYERKFGTRTDIAGYRTLVDMSEIEDLTQPSSSQVHILARSFAQSDTSNGAPRVAVIADRDFLFGLARMFKSYAEAEGAGENAVGVFRTVHEAAEFLKLPDDIVAEHLGETVSMEDS